MKIRIIIVRDFPLVNRRRSRATRETRRPYTHANNFPGRDAVERFRVIQMQRRFRDEMANAAREMDNL